MGYRLAYRSGVTVAITAPIHSSFLSGIGVAFSLGSRHALEEGSIVQSTTALHISLSHGSTPSVSTGISVLRRLLLHPPLIGEVGHWSRAVTEVEKCVLRWI